MKVKWFYRLLSLIFVITFLASCDTRGHIAVSNDIREAKIREVFISEYEVDPNPYIINDTLKIRVSNAWLERQWAYGKYGKTIIINDQYQLVILVKSDVLENYSLTWRIGINGDRYIRSCGSNCLMTDFDDLPEDIEEWPVQNGGALDSISKKTIIGKFRIHRKNESK